MKAIKELRQSFLNAYGLCALRAYSDAEADRDDEVSADHLLFGTTTHAIAEMACESWRTKNVFPTWDKAWLFYQKKGQTLRLLPEQFYNADTKELLEAWYERLKRTIEEEVIATELQFHGTLVTPSGVKVPITGTIDRLGKLNSMGEGTYRYRITDYKTNRVPYTRDEVENSVQLRMYSAWVFSKYPDAEEIEVVYDLIRFGQFRHIITRESLEDFLEWLGMMWQTIKADADPQPVLNSYCAWCNHKVTCPAFITLMKQVHNGSFAPVVVNPKNNKEWIDLWTSISTLAATIKILEGRKTEAESLFRAKLADDGVPVVVGDKEIYLKTNPRNKLDPMRVYDLFREMKLLQLFPEVVTVVKEKLEKITNGRPGMKEQVEQIIEVEYVKPTLTSRKKGTSEA